MHEAKDLALSIFKLLRETRLLEEQGSPAHEILLDPTNTNVFQAVRNLMAKVNQAIGLVDAFQKQKVYNERFIYQKEGLKSTLQRWLEIIEGFLAISDGTDQPQKIDKYNEWRSKQTVKNVETDEFIKAFTSEPKKSRVAPILA